ncbi:hypothetical protein LINPERPRIM_LOCUS36656 [Linum perenne]
MDVNQVVRKAEWKASEKIITHKLLTLSFDFEKKRTMKMSHVVYCVCHCRCCNCVNFTMYCSCFLIIIISCTRCWSAHY